MKNTHSFYIVLYVLKVRFIKLYKIEPTTFYFLFFTLLLHQHIIFHKLLEHRSTLTPPPPERPKSYKRHKRFLLKLPKMYTAGTIEN